MASTSSPRTPDQSKFRDEDSTSGSQAMDRSGGLASTASFSLPGAASGLGGGKKGLKKGKERLQRLMSRVASVRPTSMDEASGSTLMGRASSMLPPAASLQRLAKPGVPMGLSPAEQLSAFENGTFRLEARLQGLGEKGIARLRADLAQLEADASDGVRKAVHHYYTHYIKASQGIGELEGEMQMLRNILAEVGTLVSSLQEAMTGSAEVPPTVPLASSSSVPADWALTAEGARWTDSLEEVDVAIALRRPVEAREKLRALEKLVRPRDKSPSRDSADQGPHSRLQRENVLEQQTADLEERKASLIRLLEALVAETGRAGVSPSSTRAAVTVLASVAGRVHALQHLLDAHSSLLRSQQHQLLKPQTTGGGETDGANYAGALSHVVFSGVANAAADVSLIFGKDAHELTSLLVVWALKETELCALLIKRHALAPFAAPAGLGPTVSCVLLALLHCRSLEKSHGLSLAPRLLRDLWPPCEQVLQRRLKRVAEEITLQVMEEVDSMAYSGAPEFAEEGWEGLTSIFPSAANLVAELQALVDTLEPLAGPRTGAALRRAFTELFGVYIDAMCRAFEEHQTTDGPFIETLDPAVEPAMEVAVTMAEQWLPQLAAPLGSKCGPVCEAPALHTQLEELAATLGLQLQRVEV